MGSLYVMAAILLSGNVSQNTFPLNPVTSRRKTGSSPYAFVYIRVTLSETTEKTDKTKFVHRQGTGMLMKSCNYAV